MYEMATLAGVGRILGPGGRGYVLDATTMEAKPVALKVYHTKAFCKKELHVYEYLKESGHHQDYLPQYHGPDDTEVNVYRVEIVIEKVDGTRLDRLIDQIPEEELKSLEEEMQVALSDLHEKQNVCHRDIKGDNILVLRPQGSRPSSFVLIDLGEAIIRRDTTDVIWKKACRQDKFDLQQTFKGARCEKAVIAGCQLLEDTTSTSSVANTCNSDTPTPFSDELQIKISHYLDFARSRDSVERLIDQTLLSIKHPNSKLALALVRALRCFGRCKEAFSIIESCVKAESDLPLFDFQTAIIVQSRGQNSIPYYEKALSGFEAQRGTHNISTMSCR